ncbi:MAG: hypothetical protein U9N86_08520 [Bacteroidota bacterium]|nr:hypothetical protein [Bacteroidota bacterium]
MKKTIITSTLIIAMFALMVGSQSFINSNPEPIPAPSSTTIKLTNTTALDYSDACTYPSHELKVTFYGRRYPV